MRGTNVLLGLIIALLSPAIVGCASPSGPASGGAGRGRIVFNSNRNGAFDDVYVIDADGSGLTRLTDIPTYGYSLAFSPDGRRVTFTSDRDGNTEIYVMNTDGSNRTRLTDNAAIDGFSVLSPDGKWIAFASQRDGNSEIYLMKADGSAQTNVTNNPASDTYPVWQP